MTAAYVAIGIASLGLLYAIKRALGHVIHKHEEGFLIGLAIVGWAVLVAIVGLGFYFIHSFL